MALKETESYFTTTILLEELVHPLLRCQPGSLEDFLTTRAGLVQQSIALLYFLLSTDANNQVGSAKHQIGDALTPLQTGIHSTSSSNLITASFIEPLQEAMSTWLVDADDQQKAELNMIAWQLDEAKAKQAVLPE